MMGCMCVQRFITLGISFSELEHFICLYHNVLPGAICCCLHVNKIVYEEIKMLLHDLSWIPIFVQSLIFISYPVFEIRLSKLNNNNNNKKKIATTDYAI